MKKWIRLVGVLLVVLFLPVAALADTADIARIEDYLRDLRTAQADFIQNTEGAPTSRGVFYLNRPGKMRFAYQEPENSFLVADGDFIYFWDAPNKQVSQTTIGSTMADFLLRPDVRLSGDVTVDTVTDVGDQIHVTLHLTKEPQLGNMTLRFQKQPLMILGWQVVDAQGVISDLSLNNLQTGMPLDKKLFYFSRPNFGQRDEADER